MPADNGLVSLHVPDQHVAVSTLFGLIGKLEKELEKAELENTLLKGLLLKSDATRPAKDVGLSALATACEKEWIAHASHSIVKAPATDKSATPSAVKPTSPINLEVTLRGSPLDEVQVDIIEDSSTKKRKLSIKSETVTCLDHSPLHLTKTQQGTKFVRMWRIAKIFHDACGPEYKGMLAHSNMKLFGVSFKERKKTKAWIDAKRRRRGPLASSWKEGLLADIGLAKAW